MDTGEVVGQNPFALFEYPIIGSFWNAPTSKFSNGQ